MASLLGTSNKNIVLYNVFYNEYDYYMIIIYLECLNYFELFGLIVGSGPNTTFTVCTVFTGPVQKRCWTPKKTFGI